MSTKSHLLSQPLDHDPTWANKSFRACNFPSIFLIKDPMVRYLAKKNLPNEMEKKKKNHPPHPKCTHPLFFVLKSPQYMY